MIRNRNHNLNNSDSLFHQKTNLYLYERRIFQMVFAQSEQRY